MKAPKPISFFFWGYRAAVLEMHAAVRRGATVNAAIRQVKAIYGGCETMSFSTLRRRSYQGFYSHSLATRCRCSPDSAEEIRGRLAWVLAFTRHMDRHPKARPAVVWERITGLSLSWLLCFIADEASRSTHLPSPNS